MKEFKGAIFDLDGTIIDSMNVWQKIDIKFLQKRNIFTPKDYIEKINDMSFVLRNYYNKSNNTIHKFLVENNINKNKIKNVSK